MNKKSKLLLASLGMAVAVGAGVAGYNTTVQAEPTVSIMEVSHVVDVSDDRQLVGVVDNVFIGKVVAEKGNKKLDNMPETQFTVEVLDNIKGDLSGTVVVNQQGGYEDKEKKHKVIAEGDSFLEAGKTYLFATKVNDVEGWHTIVPVVGNQLIEDEASKAKMKDRFVKAHKEEIPFKTK